MNEHRKLDGNEKDTKLRARVSDLSPTQLVLLVFAAFLTGMCQYGLIFYFFFSTPLVSLVDPLLLSNVILLVLTVLLMYWVRKRETRMNGDSEERQTKLSIGSYSSTSFFLLLNAALFTTNISSYLLGLLSQYFYNLLPQDPINVRNQSMLLVGLATNLILLLLGLLLAFFVLRKTQTQTSPKDMPPSNKENKS